VTSGTLPYMSPQQLAGKHPQVADDIYALGATLYELLASKPPFYTGDITHQVLREPPEPLDERLAALGLANAVPPDVAALVMACLAKEPAQRPQSARAVAEWIGLEVVSKPSLQSLTSEVFGEAESGKSVGPSEAGDAMPPPPGSRRNRLLAGVAGAALVLVVLGGWYWTTRPPARGGHPAQPQAAIPEPDSSSVPVKPTPPPATATQDIPAPAAPTPVVPEPGFVSLFNGHDLSGWDGDPRFWSVKEGCITGESSPGNIPEGSTCLIWKEGVVDDFELRLSYRLFTGNCGIQYRSKILDAKSWFVGGYQVHVGYAADGPGYTGILYEEGMPRHRMAERGEKVVWGVNGQKQVVGGTGKTRDELRTAIKQGDWNDCVIIARGNHLVHQINGNLMIEVTDNDPKHRSLSGIIALQIHPNGGKPMKIQFKNIRLKRLTTGPADPSAKAAGETTASRGSPPDLWPGQRWTNSLGQVFVPVPGTEVLFCVWETRVQDFEAFASASGYQDGRMLYGHHRDGWKERTGDWRNPGFVQAADHPVVGVNWDDAQAFCRWLTAKEQSEGTLERNREYRLPTDAEWSQAVGNDKFPWGNNWPPPTGAGNYASEETQDGDWPRGFPVIRDYRDGYARTSPVGSFPPNKLSLYDLGGNVWEWCADWYRKEMNDPAVLKAFPVLAADGAGRTYRVYRGGGWNDSDRRVLLSANRMGNGFAMPSKRYDNTGFRVVLADMSSR